MRNCGGRTYSSGGVSGNLPSMTLFPGKELHSLILFMEITCSIVRVSMSVHVNINILLLLAASFPPDQTPKEVITKKGKTNVAVYISD